jgi:hypothetical protein
MARQLLVAQMVAAAPSPVDQAAKMMLLSLALVCSKASSAHSFPISHAEMKYPHLNQQSKP